jgi:hypothetical protein
MENNFVLYNQALELKELGFDDVCLSFYNGKFLDSTDYNFDDGTSKDVGLCINAPLKQQVFRWFREKYEIYGIVGYYGKSQWSIEMLNYKGNELLQIEDDFNTYEEAENACIDKLIEIAKQQDNAKQDIS